MGLKVLIAEDDPSVVKLVKFVLSSHSVDDLSSIQGLRETEISAYDLILLDDELSDGSAIDWLNTADVAPEVWVISAKKRDPSEKLKGVRWLQKPFDPKRLQSEVEMFCQSDFQWARLLKEYRFHVRGEREKLQALLASEGDREEAIRTVHSIAGSAGGYGFSHLSEVASTTESDLRAFGEGEQSRFWDRLQEFLTDSSWLPALAIE